MDTNSKRRKAEAVRRAFSRLLKSTGYVRTKTTFWVVPNEYVIHFVHLHLFSFMPAFRVHFGVRVLNDDFPTAALNGPSSYDDWAQGTRRYAFEFSDAEGTTQSCAIELTAYVDEIGGPCFERFRDPEQLLHDPGSPLQPSEKRALAGGNSPRVRPGRILKSRELLGVA